MPSQVRCGFGYGAARAWRLARRLGLPGGMLLAVPVPAAAAIAEAEVEAWVASATAEAAAAGITGQAVTPWVLARLASLSGGRTLVANQALLVNNARVAGDVAGRIAGDVGGSRLHLTKMKP